jgi:hypothetical protein
MYTECTVLFSSAQAHFTKENKKIFAFQTSSDAGFLSKSSHRLYYCPVNKYNWAKHSVCTTSLNEKAVAHSTLLGSKMSINRSKTNDCSGTMGKSERVDIFAPSCSAVKLGRKDKPWTEPEPLLSISTCFT